MKNNIEAYQIKRRELEYRKALHLSRFSMKQLQELSERLGTEIFESYKVQKRLNRKLMDQQLLVELAISFKEL